MRDVTEILLATVTLAMIGVLVVNAQGTATAVTAFGNAWSGILRAASFQGSGNYYGTGA